MTVFNRFKVTNYIIEYCINCYLLSLPQNTVVVVSVGVTIAHIATVAMTYNINIVDIIYELPIKLYSEVMYESSS